MTPWGQIAVVVILQRLLHIFVSGTEVSCNHTLTSPRGDIRSPNFPHPYPAGVDCQWHIDLSNVSGVTGLALNFKHYATQVINTVNLPEEDLLIYETNPSFSNATPNIYRGGDMYISRETEIWIQFSSATNITLKSTNGDSLGFDISYSAVIPSEVCQPPEISANSIVTGSNYSVGSYMSYYCNAGHRLVGSSVSVCVLKNSVPTWSNPSPECLDTCPEPSIRHGNVEYPWPDLKVNSSAMFQCDSPYILIGNVRRDCVQDNRGLPAWNAQFPECIIPDCSESVVFNQFPGDVVSPGYGTDVILGGKTCRWEIRADPGFPVEIYYLYFDVAENSQLDVYDTGEDRLLIQRTIKGQIPRNVTSRTNKMEIVYRGPFIDVTSHRGFYIRYAMGTPFLLGQDDEAHGTRTPFIPPVTFAQDTPSPSPKLSITYVEDGSSTIKIAVGVTIPVVIMLSVVLGLYLWYRKKYPVRMIIGREFAKFSNPDYSMKGHSTLTLVREDAEDFFSTASRSTSNVNLVMDEHGPHYVNAGYHHDDGELDVEEHQPIDQDEEDRELMERKKYLFTSVDMYDGESSKKAGDSSSSDSDSDAGSRSGGSQASKKTQEVRVVVEPEAVEDTANASDHDTANAASSDKELSDNSRSDAALSSFNSQFPSEFPRKTSLAVLMDRSRDRRAFTNEERPMRRFSFDMCMSARGRSSSAKTPAEFSKESDKLDMLLNKSKVIGSECQELSEVNEEEGAETNVSETATETGKEVAGITTQKPNDVEVQSNSETKTLASDCGVEAEDALPCNALPRDNDSITSIDDKPTVTEDKVNETSSTHNMQSVSDTSSELGLGQYDCEDGDVPKVSVNLKEINPLPSDSEKEEDDEQIKNARTPTTTDSIHSANGDCSFEKETCQRKDSDTCQRKDSDTCQRKDSATSNKFMRSDSNSSDDIPKHERRTGVVDAPIPAEIIPKSIEPPGVNKNLDECDGSTERVIRELNGSADESQADDTTSQSSTGSHVSGAYNFGNSSPDSVNHEDSADGTISPKSRSSSDASNHSRDTNGALVHHIPPENDSNSADNPDTSSLSSLDPSLLDSSVEISSSPVDSPMPRKRSRDEPNSASQTKKVAAPVFNVEDGSESDDASSSEAEDEHTRQRKRSTSSTHQHNVMPGIREESDTDEGQTHKRRVDTSGVNGNRIQKEEEEEEEEGREFTDADLLDELSDDSTSIEVKPRSGSADHITTVSAGKFVFGEEEDDVDV